VRELKVNIYIYIYIYGVVSENKFWDLVAQESGFGLNLTLMTVKLVYIDGVFA